MANDNFTYHDNKTASRWEEDTATVQGQDKPIVKVYFDIDGTEVDWTCWVDDLYKDGQPSTNLRGRPVQGASARTGGCNPCFEAPASASALHRVPGGATDKPTGASSAGFSTRQWQRVPLRPVRCDSGCDSGCDRAASATGPLAFATRLPAQP